MRITGQLIDATTGTHLWADRFDGALEDIFELQDRSDDEVVGCDRAQALSRPRSSAPSASRPKTWTPTTAFCAACGAHTVSSHGDAAGEASLLFERAIDTRP